MADTMTDTIRRTAAITVPLPTAAALTLFTPQGERRWAAGWDPRYAAPGRTDEVGAVFVTAHGAHETTWIVIDRGPCSIRYARVTVGVSAGTVAVELAGGDGGDTRASVTYDLTALSDAGRTWLAGFAARYDEEIAGWELEIGRMLARPDAADRRDQSPLSRPRSASV